MKRLVTLLAAVAVACTSGQAEPMATTGADPVGDVTTTVPPPTTTTTVAPPTSAPTTTTTTATTTTTTIEVVPGVTLGFVGDTSFTHGLHSRDPFGDIGDWLAGPDLTVANLETTIAEAGVGSPADKEFVFKSPPESVELLVEAGIDVVSLANNHSLDYGITALERTLELVRGGGLATVGAGRNQLEAYTPLVVEVEGRRVGIVAFSHIGCSGREEVAWACPGHRDAAALAVAAAAGISDIAVVVVHWGIELARCPNAYQRELAQAWAEAGADLIIGHHPHVLQGVERIGDTWVVYSVGNWAFPSARSASANTAFFEVHVDAGGQILMRARPVRIVAGRPTPADEDQTEGMLSDLGRYSYGYRLTDDGWVVPTATTGSCGS